jgi:lactoylglutathione lyase
MATWKPEGKLGVGVSLWFICRDALAIYDELRCRVIETSERQVGNGM